MQNVLIVLVKTESGMNYLIYGHFRPKTFSIWYTFRYPVLALVLSRFFPRPFCIHIINFFPHYLGAWNRLASIRKTSCLRDYEYCSIFRDQLDSMLTRTKLLYFTLSLFQSSLSKNKRTRQRRSKLSLRGWLHV